MLLKKKVQIASSLHVNEPLIAFCKQYLCKWSPTLQGCADKALTSPFVTSPAGPPTAHPIFFLRSPGTLSAASFLLLPQHLCSDVRLPEPCLLPYMQVLLSHLLSPGESQGDFRPASMEGSHAAKAERSATRRLQVALERPHQTFARLSPRTQHCQHLSISKINRKSRKLGKSRRHVTLLPVRKDLLKTNKRRPTSEQKEIFKQGESLENKTH